MHIHTTDNPAKPLGDNLSSTINEHNGDIICLLSGGSALDVIKFIEIPDRREKSEHHTTKSTSQNVVEQSSSYFECRTIFMMGDERASRESCENNSLQLQDRYPDHCVTKHLLAAVPKENESVENFATRIETKFLETLTELSNPKILHGRYPKIKTPFLS